MKPSTQGSRKLRVIPVFISMNEDAAITGENSQNLLLFVKSIAKILTKAIFAQ